MKAFLLGKKKMCIQFMWLECTQNDLEIHFKPAATGKGEAEEQGAIRGNFHVITPTKQKLPECVCHIAHIAPSNKHI